MIWHCLVDDMIITHDDCDAIETLKYDLAHHSTIKYLGCCITFWVMRFLNIKEISFFLDKIHVGYI